VIWAWFRAWIASFLMRIFPFHKNSSKFQLIEESSEVSATTKKKKRSKRAHGGKEEPGSVDYVFDDSIRWRCIHCDVTLDAEHVRAHCEGKRHKREIEADHKCKNQCFEAVPKEEEQTAALRAGVPAPRKLSEIEERQQMIEQRAWAKVDKAQKAKAKAKREQLRSKTFALMEHIDGDRVNVLEGLALHKEVIPVAMEKDLIAWTEMMMGRGRTGCLRGDTYLQSTYLDPITGARGEGRIVMQFGVFYDYAAHCICPELPVEEMDATLEALVDRLVSVGALPASVRPDTCIVNVYNKGDNIPPHIDHTDYPRPFSTLSLESEAEIVMGTKIALLGNGQFKAGFAETLPTRSLLVLSGNGANLAKHCIPAVQCRRISITLRKMPRWARDARTWL